MLKINGCEWWRFRKGQSFGSGWFLQLGPITIDCFRWDFAQYWLEVHAVNYCLVRLRFPIKEGLRG